MPRELPPAVAERVRAYREARKTERAAHEATTRRSGGIGPTSALDLFIASTRATLAVSDAEKALRAACEEVGMGELECATVLTEAGQWTREDAN
jgi:hypothetical protein